MQRSVFLWLMYQFVVYRCADVSISAGWNSNNHLLYSFHKWTTMSYSGWFRLIHAIETLFFSFLIVGHFLKQRTLKCPNSFTNDIICLQRISVEGFTRAMATIHLEAFFLFTPSSHKSVYSNNNSNNKINLSYIALNVDDFSVMSMKSIPRLTVFFCSRRGTQHPNNTNFTQ